MLFFKHSFKIEINQPLYKVVRLLEENINTETKFLWPWKKRKPFSGSISEHGFKITKDSYLTQYKPIVYGKLQSSQNLTLIMIQIEQTVFFYLSVFFVILSLSGVFVFIEGTSLEKIIASLVVSVIYYSICMFFFVLNIKSTKKKFNRIFSGDNS